MNAWKLLAVLAVVADGIIRYHWPEVIPRGHAQRVLQKLMTLEQQQ